MVESWRPTASLQILRHRARLLAQIRDYFARHRVLEVDTPCLSPTAATEPTLSSITCQVPGIGRPCHLRTSPEGPMKRLLAAGSGDIYQICHAFRGAEHGRLHRAEFMLLEWYRVGIDHHALMTDVAALLRYVGYTHDIATLSFDELWRERFGCGAHAIASADLADIVRRLPFSLDETAYADRQCLYDCAYSAMVGDTTAREGAYFVYAFPQELRAYARVAGRMRQAARFELIVDGVELANGYHEIVDSDEQRHRFEDDNVLRRQRGLAAMAVDQDWLQALQAGLPACAGVAVGLDRLLMLLHGHSEIAAVQSFAAELDSGAA